MTNPAARSAGTSGRGLEVIRRWPTANAKQWAHAFVAECAGDPNVLAIVAIGSAVRDVPSSANLDFVLVYRSAPLNLHSPIEVDLRQYASAEVKKLTVKGHDLLGWAVRMGEVVLERDNFWTDLSVKVRGNLPWPDATVARQRAEQAHTLLDYARTVGDHDAAAEQLVSYLTHVARSVLLDCDVYPASRPELPDQLRKVGEPELADRLAVALRQRVD